MIDSAEGEYSDSLLGYNFLLFQLVKPVVLYSKKKRNCHGRLATLIIVIPSKDDLLIH